MRHYGAEAQHAHIARIAAAGAAAGVGLSMPTSPFWARKFIYGFLATSNGVREAKLLHRLVGRSVQQ